MTKRALLLVVVLLCLVPASFAGTVIYNNGAPNQQNGNEMTEWIQAEDFTLGSTQTVTGVTFWTIEDPSVNGYAGSIWYAIYTNNGTFPNNSPNLGAPGVEGFLQATNLTRTFIQGGILGVYNEYEYTFDIQSFTAQAGTTYWLGLHNGPLSNDQRAEVYWETTNPNGTTTGNEDILPPAGDGWSNNGQEHAFELLGGTGSTPEPGSLLLFGTGVVGLAGLIRRKLNL